MELPARDREGESRQYLDPSRQARLRRLAVNSSAALVTKGVSILVTLLLFPFLVNYLGKGEFAVWIAVVSISQVLSWTDLGLGNSMMTVISRQTAMREGVDAVRATISSAYASIGTIAIGVALVISASWSARGLFVSGAGNSEAEPYFWIGFAAFVAYLPSSLAGRIQAGLGLASRNFVYQAASSLAMGALSLMAVVAHGSLAVLIAIACFTPVAFNLANTLAFFARRRMLRPALRHASREQAARLVRLGGLFLALQLGGVAMNGADSIIVLKRAGASEVVDYAAVARLFGAISGFGSMLFAQLWPEYGAAHARGEHVWIRRTFLRSLGVATGFGVGVGLIVMFFSGPIFRLWLGSAVQPGHVLVALAAVWLVIELCGQCIAMLLNGMAVVLPQVVLTLSFVALCLPLKWYLSAVNGAVGIYEATIVSYVLTIVLPYAILLPRMLGKAARP